MNNYELYATLRKEIGITGTVYIRDVIGTYGKTEEVYTPVHIKSFVFDNVANCLKMDIESLRFTGYKKENVHPVELYLPSPINSCYHGDMIPVRVYFEMREKTQGSDDVHFSNRYNRSAVELEKNSIERIMKPFVCFRKDPMFHYDKIIFSGPCTIVIWKDGTKTMARVSKVDEFDFDPEKGVAICFMKRALGHTETNKTLKIADNMWELKNTAFADIDVTQVTAKPAT